MDVKVKSVEVYYRELTYYEYVSGSFNRTAFWLYMLITLILAMIRNDFFQRIVISLVMWICLESFIYWLMKPKPIVEVYKI